MSSTIILTIDLEDWYHIFDDSDPSSWQKKEQRVVASTYKILDVLDQRNIKATFMVLGWVAKKYPLLLQDISNQGHDIGTHSYEHNLIYTQTKDQFKQDLIKSIGTISDSIGKEVDMYRAPGFSIKQGSLWALEVLSEVGIKYDLSLFPGNHRYGGVDKRLPIEPFIIRTEFGDIREYPVTVDRILSQSIARCGGGYFRLLPYFLLKSLLDNSDYQMSYFHPRDFDYHQPRIKMSFMNYFKSYVGIKNAESKFNKLISEHKMVSLSHDIKNRNWEGVETLDISQLKG
jgi:polysaccharide deacetylase family protein (PEP-CTERM system associated)